MPTLTFDQAGDFAAYHAACDWCTANGISYGSSQRGAPAGLLYGDFQIAKWRNLTAQERRELDGLMAGDFRNGPVTITIDGRSP